MSPDVTSHVSQGTFFGLPLAKRVMKDPSSRPEYSITPFLSVAKPCGNGKGLGNTLDYLDLLRLHENVSSKIHSCEHAIIHISGLAVLNCRTSAVQNLQGW